MNRKFTALILIIFAFSLNGFSQGDLGLYQLNQSLPQANNLNPAFQPEHRVVIGLPIISSIRLFVDNDGLAFNDYFTYDANDNLILDTLGLPNAVNDVQRFGMYSEIGLFYFGLRGKRSYFSLSLNEVTDFRFNYSGDLVRWAIQGPADPRISGNDLDISAFGTKVMGYHELALGYSRAFNDRLKIGIKLKYLQGIGAIDTEKISGSIHVGADSVTVASGEILVNTAGLALADEDDPDYTSYLTNNNNRGGAIDIGASFDLTDKINLSASVKDIGFIKWSEYTRSYEVDPVVYTYTGFDLLDLVNKSANDQFLQAEIDSIESLYNSREVDGTTFTTTLRPKTYLGANYKLGKKHNVGALVYFDFFKGHVNPSVALSYNLKLGRILNMVVNTAYVNGTFTGFGAGFTLKLTGLQVYGSSDQVMSAIYPSRASVAEAHAGINFVFGRIKKPVEEPEEDAVEEMTEEEFLEELEEETIEEDTVQTDTVAVENVEPIQEPDTVVVDTVQTAPPTPPVEEVIEEVEEELSEVYDEINERTIIDQGTHSNELPPGHYVIVGVFSSKANAEKYSDQLKSEGFNNDYGFVSKRNAYYVHVKNSDNLTEVRKARDQFRKLRKFQFEDAWVLTMVE